MSPRGSEGRRLAGCQILRADGPISRHFSEETQISIHLNVLCANRVPSFDFCVLTVLLLLKERDRHWGVVHRILSDQENREFVLGIPDYCDRRQRARRVAL